MELCSLASGSEGNCVYVAGGGTELLVDAGISARRIEAGLKELGTESVQLQGVLITHEHIDHIKGIGILARKYRLPIYGTRETLAAVCRCASLGEVPTEGFHEVKPDESFELGGLRVNPFRISHDAGNPVGYTFEAEGKKCAIATDLGMFDSYIISKLHDSEILYVESNHDENMLMVGSYPYSLKLRIMGEKGHLSNDTAARMVTELLHDGLKYILLAHMSKENNYPELAYETMRAEVEHHWNCGTELPVIRVANRSTPSEPVFI